MIIDGSCPAEGPATTVKDAAWVLVGRVEVNNTLWGDVAVEQEGNQTVVKQESISSFVVLKHGLVGFVRVFQDSGMVAVLEEGLEVFFCSLIIAKAGDAITENALNVG